MVEEIPRFFCLILQQSTSSCGKKIYSKHFTSLTQPKFFPANFDFTDRVFQILISNVEKMKQTPADLYYTQVIFPHHRYDCIHKGIKMHKKVAVFFTIYFIYILQTYIQPD